MLRKVLHYKWVRTMLIEMQLRELLVPHEETDSDSKKFYDSENLLFLYQKTFYTEDNRPKKFLAAQLIPQKALTNLYQAQHSN